MAFAVLLAVGAVLLLLAAGRELAASRPGGLDSLFDRSPGGASARPRSSSASPAGSSRAGLGARVPMATVLLAKLGAAALGAIAGSSRLPPPLAGSRSWSRSGFPPPAFSSPMRCSSAGRAAVAEVCSASLPDALDLLAVGSTSGRTAAAGFAEIARSGGRAACRRAADCRQRAGLRRAAPDRPRRPARRGCPAASSRRSAPRSNARAGWAPRSPISSAARPRRCGATSGARSRRRAARAAPKIQLVVALVLVPSVLLMIAAALIANADVLLAGF